MPRGRGLLWLQADCSGHSVRRRSYSRLQERGGLLALQAGRTPSPLLQASAFPGREQITAAGWPRIRQRAVLHSAASNASRRLRRLQPPSQCSFLGQFVPSWSHPLCRRALSGSGEFKHGG
uniref:Uncharacterized protein n=1 Tax=Arundo donax TaxID=35708 RepID=A0A0A9BCE0_ARUDO